MTDKEIVKRAKEAEKRTGFGELVHSPISKGVNSAYGIGFIEGMVEYRNSLQEEPVSEDKMTISKEWFEHCKKSWYNEGYIAGEFNRDRQFEEPVSEELEKAAAQDVCEVVNNCSSTGIPNDHIPSWVQDAMVNEFIHGANWQKERIEEVLLSEVLPCFMHGGEADEVMAKLDEVLNKKK